MSLWSQLGFQDSASPLGDQLIFFHDYAMMILLMIFSLIMYLVLLIIFNKFIDMNTIDGQKLEIIWTLLPAVILFFLAFPSLRLLYLLDEEKNSQLSLKTLGHQWYWSYEYTDFNSLSFDSYMTPLINLNTGAHQLLEVDNRAILPTKIAIRILVCSSDVIHSWTIPSLGIKVDAVPGRLNQLNFSINYSGVFYGQCSEICGANHSFMPIVIEAIPLKSYISWLTTLQCFAAIYI